MATCKSCGAEIEWVKTPAGRTIPLDVGAVDNGNLQVFDGVAVPRKIGSAAPRRRSHFATCPHAASHRSPR